jgi:hypothetical protein
VSKWLALLLAYLAGSFFGIMQVLGLVRGVATPKPAPAPA